MVTSSRLPLASWRQIAVHAPTDQQHRRQPSLGTVDAGLERPRHQVLGLAGGGDHVLVEGRQQPHRPRPGARARGLPAPAGLGQPGQVGGERVGGRALDLDPGHLLAQALQQPGPPGRAGDAPPAGEVFAGDRARGGQEPAGHLVHGLLGVVVGPAAQPGVGAGEADLLALAGGEAEQPEGGRRLEQRPPALAELAAQALGPGQLAHPVGQLLAGQRLAVQGLGHGLVEPLQLLQGDAEAPLPGPGLPAAPGRQGGLPAGELGRREQVQGAAHGPGLDQAALGPQGAADGVGLQVLDPRGQGQLGRRQHLGVEPGDPAGDLQHGLGRGPLVQVVAGRPPGHHLGPAEPGRRGRGGRHLRPAGAGGRPRSGRR